MSAKRTAGYEARVDKVEQARAERQRQMRAGEERARARRQRVADIAKIIGRRAKARLDEIEAAVSSVDARWQAHRDEDAKQRDPDQAWPPMPVHNEEKTIARNLGSAIGRLEKQLQVRNRRGVIARATHGYGEEFAEFEQQLKRWRECFEGWGGKRRRRVYLFDPPSLDRLTVEQRVKRDAAAAAGQLFKRHGLKPTATRKSAKTKASDFVVVAALLYGDKRADLYTQCRTIVEEARSVAAAAAASSRRR
jgi:hypothetical protein